MIISIAVLIALFIVVFGVWWHYFFGTPNPQLSQTSVSIQSSSMPAAAVTSDVAVTNPLVDGENPPLAEEPLSVDGITFNVEVASSMTEQARGLSYRPTLAANSGMLFVFGSGTIQTFWMQGMNFPLDMIWISGTTVVGSSQNAPAPAPGTQIWNLKIYASPGNTDKVLEVPAGTVAKYNIKVGDSVTIGTAK